MKKLLIILCFLAIKATGQTIDTSFKSMTACPIVPFKAKWTDTTNVTYLGVRIISDNLSNNCTLYWALMDSTGLVHVDGNATIAGQLTGNQGVYVTTATSSFSLNTNTAAPGTATTYKWHYHVIQ